MSEWFESLSTGGKIAAIFCAGAVLFYIMGGGTSDYERCVKLYGPEWAEDCVQHERDNADNYNIQ